DAGVIAVDVDFGLLRLHFDPQRSARIDAVGRVRIRRRIAPCTVVAVPWIVEPERIVEPAVVSADEYNRPDRADPDDPPGANLGVGPRRSCQKKHAGQERSRPGDGLMCAHWKNPQSGRAGTQDRSNGDASDGRVSSS